MRYLLFTKYVQLVGMGKIISVAVGILFNSHHDVLMAWRDARRNPGNCWEFPGGKIEKDETPYQALCRELEEEIGVRVQRADPLDTFSHEYGSASVILHSWCISQYQDIPHGKEGQMLAWVAVRNLHFFKLPSANYNIVNLLQVTKNPLFIE